MVDFRQILCHNVTLEYGWPWLIFIWRQPFPQCDIGQWLAVVDYGWFSYWDNLFHNAMLDHGWSWMTMLSHYDVRPRDNLCHNVIMVIDHGLFSYWDNICDNAILKHGWTWMNRVITMWHWTKRLFLSQCDHGWPWLIVVDHGLFSSLRFLALIPWVYYSLEFVIFILGFIYLGLIILIPWV